MGITFHLHNVLHLKRLHLIRFFYEMCSNTLHTNYMCLRYDILFFIELIREVLPYYKYARSGVTSWMCTVRTSRDVYVYTTRRSNVVTYTHTPCAGHVYATRTMFISVTSLQSVYVPVTPNVTYILQEYRTHTQCVCGAHFTGHARTDNVSYTFPYKQGKIIITIKQKKIKKG